jgi:hypothetical protein
MHASERPRLDREPSTVPGGALAHVEVGLFVGILFGGAIVTATYWTSPESLGAVPLIVQGFNELLFP